MHFTESINIVNGTFRDLYISVYNNLHIQI